MKKHNEGYALAFVLVMLAVLALLSSVILAASWRNMRFQQIAAQRMSDEYAVKGQLDRIMIQLEALGSAGSIDLKNDPASGLQIVVVENIVVMRARSGQIQGDCVLVLKDAINDQETAVPVTITDADSDGVYAIANLGGVECVYYEIYTAEEVAADERVPEEYTGTVPTEETTAGSDQSK